MREKNPAESYLTKVDSINARIKDMSVDDIYELMLVTECDIVPMITLPEKHKESLIIRLSSVIPKERQF